MKREDAISFCRYYNGNSKNDIENDLNPETQTIKKNERAWVELVTHDDLTDELSERLSEYLSAGLREFEKFDDTPITLKAVLFNRFIKYNERYDIEAFKKWYLDSYIKNGKI